MKTNIADRRLYRDRTVNTGGKGDKPRPNDKNKWLNAPIWEVMGPKNQLKENNAKSN